MIVPWSLRHEFACIPSLFILALLPAVPAAGDPAGSGAASWREAAAQALEGWKEGEAERGPLFAIGPLACGQQLDPALKPAAVDLEAEHPGAGGRKLRWMRMDGDAGKEIDLRALLGSERATGSVYVSVTFSAPRPGTVPISLRAGGAVKAWLNGALIADRGPGDGWIGGGWEPKEAVFLRLDSGRNHLLLKLEVIARDDRWPLHLGRPGPEAVRYSLMGELERGWPGAFEELRWLDEDGLDLLALWPAAQREPEAAKKLAVAAPAAAMRARRLWELLSQDGASVDGREGELEGRIGAAAAAAAGASPAEVEEAYFLARSACHRLETSPGGQILLDWLRLDGLTLESLFQASCLEKAISALRRGLRLLEDYRGMEADPSRRPDEALKRLLGECEAAAQEDLAGSRRLYLAAHGLVRDLAFQNPLLGFSRVVFYKRHAQRTMNIHRHQFPSARYTDLPPQAGGDLYVLSPVRPDGRLQALIGGRLGRGLVRGYDLSFDARRIVFGFWNAERQNPPPPVRFEYDCYITEDHSHLYELELEGGALWQLTREPWHDLDPCYLPDGRIAFASERCGFQAECDPAPWSEVLVNLYTMKDDGTGIRRLISNKDSDNFPRVLNDGRLLYTHWEYHERHWLYTQTLWTSRPDGTQQDAFFKQHLNAPLSLEESQPIPGSRKVVSVATGHHTNAAGAIVRVNPAAGIASPEGIEIVTPGVFPFEGGLAGKLVAEGGVGGYLYLGSFIHVLDWGRWGYHPAAEDMQEVSRLAGEKCGGCHRGADLARREWVHPQDPAKSLFLLAPLSREAGGWEKCGKAVFQGADDPAYLALLEEARKVTGKMHADPGPSIKELFTASFLWLNK